MHSESGGTDSTQMPEFHDHDLVVVPVSIPPGTSIPLLLYDGGQISKLAYDFITSPRYSGLSSTSRDQAVKAIGLLHDCYIKTSSTNSQLPRKANRFLDFFAKALIYGTVQTDGSCPYALYWRPKNWDHALSYIRHARRFLQSLVDKEISVRTDHPDSGFSEFAASAYHRERKAHYSLLFHLHSKKDNPRANYPHQFGPDNPKAIPATKSFPEKYVWPMIFDGCKKNERSIDRQDTSYSHVFNVRNQLAYLLLFMGGIRESNLFHIFVNDIVPTPNGSAQVNLYHPAKGAIRRRSKSGSDPRIWTRQEFLREEYGIVPRHMLHKKLPLFAGWKNLLLTRGAPEYYSQVHWLHPEAGILFWRLHCIYVSLLRPSNCDHPYYFVSLGNQSHGRPWKVSSLVDAFRTSVRRVGLVPSKTYGTTPHGGRHYYGITAAELGIEPRVRQVMMMHRHILSQHRYQLPKPSAINRAIASAFEKLSSDQPSSNETESRPSQSFFDPLAFITSEIDLYSALEAEISDVSACGLSSK